MRLEIRTKSGNTYVSKHEEDVDLEGVKEFLSDVFQYTTLSIVDDLGVENYINVKEVECVKLLY